MPTPMRRVGGKVRESSIGWMGRLWEGVSPVVVGGRWSGAVRGRVECLISKLLIIVAVKITSTNIKEF